MNIGSVGNTGVDYPKYQTRQIEQKEQEQEASEQQVKQSVAMQQAAGSRESYAKPQSNTTTETGASSAAAMSSQLAETQVTDDDEESNQELINKANSGSTLTHSEMSRLKEADPALYSRVVKAEQAREELRNQMKQNPSGAKQAMQSAIFQNNADGQELVRKALADEYVNFASKYDQVELSAAVRG